MLLIEQELREYGEFVEQVKAGESVEALVYAKDVLALLAHIRAQDEALSQKDAELEHVRRALGWLGDKANYPICVDPVDGRYCEGCPNREDNGFCNGARITYAALTATKDPTPAP